MSPAATWRTTGSAGGSPPSPSGRVGLRRAGGGRRLGGLGLRASPGAGGTACFSACAGRRGDGVADAWATWLRRGRGARLVAGAAPGPEPTGLRGRPPDHLAGSGRTTRQRGAAVHHGWAVGRGRGAVGTIRRTCG